MSRVRFDRFLFDPANRRLTRDGVAVDLAGRYLDALALLLAHPGQLVTKDRFHGEVWRGIPVTDEALTQCIRSLRRALGDSASSPRLIETVPKHGYRFIAPLEPDPGAETAIRKAGMSVPPWRTIALLGAAGTVGGGLAGLGVGLVYGFAGAATPLQPGMGAFSILLVLVSLSIVAALSGAVGISFGIAAARLLAGRAPWPLVGGALGGLIVGAIAKLLGVDAFALVLGRSPGDITGAGEGALLGAVTGLGVWVISRIGAARGLAAVGLVAAVAGVVISLAGGRMMAGSLDLLARGFPASRLPTDNIGALFGDPAFGSLALALSGAFEGVLFVTAIAAALTIAARQLD